MTIYIIDVDLGLIMEQSYDVSDMEQFRKDMNDSCPGEWFEDIEDAMEALAD